jgi:heme-degrading monooxygenase HmoA
VHARVSTYQGPADQIDEGVRHAQESILPRIQEMDGFQGVYFLVDRQSGKGLSITLWESEEAMRASEEAANQLRSESAEASGEEILGVERYEVAIAPERS